jgi:SAM-dependent methyltransferase
VPAPLPSEDDRRLAFGRVAELYDEARPSYPAAAIDAILAAAALAPGGALYEVGAGTGKATVLFAERGYGVTAIEPSAEMARVARQRCARYRLVTFVESDFEHWRAPEPRRLLASAQAWHWVDPSVAYLRAYEALVPGGTLAAMWNFPDWPQCVLQPELSAAYRAHVPELRPDFPMHPDSRPERLDTWRAGSYSSRWFTAPEVHGFRWTQWYGTEDYIRLLQTHQDHILMTPDRRAPLFETISTALQRAGGGFDFPLVTWVCTLTRR